MQVRPATHAVGAQPLDDGIEQHSMQRAAMDRVLRIGVARIASERLAIDQLPEPVEEHRLAREHADARQCGLKAQQCELVRRVRKDVDANAQRPHFGHRFVDAHGDSCALQREGERQSSDACADDRNFHCFGLSSGARA